MRLKKINTKKKKRKLSYCYDVAVLQINYPSLKHNTQDSIEQARGWYHEKGSSQIFMLDDMQFGGGGWMLSRIKQKKKNKKL
jgi:hypothetical protein